MHPSARTAFIRKFLSNSFTAEEHEQFVNWVKQADNTELEEAWEHFTAIESEIPDHEAPPASFRDALERRLDLIDKPTRIHRFRWYAAAAVIVLVAGAAGFFWMNRKETISQPVAPSYAQIDLPPGGNKATLTLSGGRTISLDDASSGKLATENGVIIQKDANGQIHYSIAENIAQTEETIYNTITTPRGGQYEVNLPDGSIVWLNAASSLHFPVNFTGKQRRVTVTGEAYFNIKKDRNKPFIVATGSQEVEVLGTEFNVNSYSVSSISTSLVAGSVRVTNSLSKQQTILQPGRQAVLNSNGIAVTGFKEENVISWRKGLFSYSNASLNNVMADFERWYDVEVVFEGKIPEFDFTGDIPRRFKASQFLEIMSSYPVKFRLEAAGNKQRLIVSAR